MYTNRHISDLRLELLFHQLYEHYSELDCNNIFRIFMQCIYFKCSKYICLVFSRPQALHGYLQPSQCLWELKHTRANARLLLRFSSQSWHGLLKSWLILPCRLLLELWPSHCRSALRSARTVLTPERGTSLREVSTVPTCRPSRLVCGYV